MKTLVTGSTGFVGANLVEGLTAAGYSVRALHRSTSRLDALEGLAYKAVIGDVLDPTSLIAAMKDVEFVFHVAAVSDYWRQGGLAQLYRVNVGGTRCVLEAALAAGVRRVVLTSSAAAVGIPSKGNAGPRMFKQRDSCTPLRQEGKGADESTEFKLPPTQLPYGHSKLLAEEVAAEFVDRGLEVIIVNPTVILGPRDLNLISGSLILAVYHRQVFAIPTGGVNYIDVADVVTGHIAAAEKGRTGERYILGAHNLTHREAVSTIAQVLGVPAPRWPVPAIFREPLAVAVDLFNRVWPRQPLVDGNQIRLMWDYVFYDHSKAEREFNLNQPLPFAVSVERAYRWYRDNGYL